MRDLETGYVKVWRRLERSRIFTSSEAVHVFIYLLFRAAREERKITVGMIPVDLKPGQLVTGRKAISEATGINESKVYRVLELLKSEQQIEQQTNSKFSIISICNWGRYQQTEQQTEQQVNSNRTAGEHKQEGKEVKKVEKEPKTTGRFAPPTLEEVISYCQERHRGVDPQKWYNHYTSNGWKVGKNQMKDWMAAVRTWEGSAIPQPKKFEQEDHRKFL